MRHALIQTVTLGILMSGSAMAALKAPDFTIKATPSAGKTLVEATAPAQHHFNTDAPMTLELESDHSKFKPEKKSPHQVTFNVPSPAKNSAKISLFLCDDAKTFCEKHQVNATWEGTESAQRIDLKKSNAAPEKKASPHAAMDHHGFYDNVPEKAFAQARQSGKPLMIDFYGIWCPPCNELNDQVFAKQEFKKSAAAFVKLKMDADAPETIALSQRYGIQGFPTVIFASPEGDEIARVVGFRPMDQFLATMNEALGSKDKTFAEWKKKADSGDRAASDRVGLIYLDRGEYDVALRYLKNSETQLEKKAAAEIRLYESKSKTDSSYVSKWEEALEKSIKTFPNSPDSISYRETLAGVYDAQKRTDDARKLRQDLIASAKNFLATPELLNGYDYSAGDLYVSIADASSELGEKEQAQKAWKSGAEIFRKKIETGAARGGTLELAHCLRKLGQTDEAEKLYQKMQKAYPSEFTFWLADAKMNMQLNRFEKAQKLAKIAFDHSYGANKLDSALVLAKAWKELGKPEQAQEVITKAIESLPPMPPQPENQTARNRIRSRVESLHQLAAELSKKSP